MGNAGLPGRTWSGRPVHPHVHGERLNRLETQELNAGSSPRTWGTPMFFTSHLSFSRFIPTYMGNADAAVHRPGYRPVHPHVHGERLFASDEDRKAIGSSPRTWGTRGMLDGDVRSDRFIPTYMGNAVMAKNSRYVISVHPHVHGEREVAPGNSPIDNGSSPRTWGTPITRTPPEPVSRFIPTYMGNAYVKLHPPHGLSVHPHVHGERACPRPSSG